MLKQKNKYNIIDDIRQTAKKYPTNIALQADDVSINYSKLIIETDKIAKLLADTFPGEYQKFVFIGDDCIEYIIVSLAIIASGSVFVSAGKEITKTRYNSILKDISVDYTILQDKFCKKLQPENYEFIKQFTLNDLKFSIFKKLDKAEKKEINIPTDKQFTNLQPAFIRFSSGTTSQAKGVILSHATIRDRTESANTILKMTPEDKVLWLLPMAYHFAVTIMLFLRKGCTINIAVGASPNIILQKLLKNNISFVYATPYHYSSITKIQKDKIKLPDSVRMLISTAMPLTESVALNFYKKFNLHLNQAYGIIECGLPCINHKPNEQNILTVGRPTPGTLVLIALKDEKDSFGEIVIKSSGMFDAYYSPWITKDDATSKGLFATGDIGKFQNGFLKILGRKKNMINCLGHKIFPEQVEKVIAEHESIDEVLVYSEPHTEFGEIIIAEFVTTSDKNITKNELTSFCAKKLSPQEIPHEFKQVMTLQKTENGKLKRY